MIYLPRSDNRKKDEASKYRKNITQAPECKKMMEDHGFLWTKWVVMLPSHVKMELSSLDYSFRGCLVGDTTGSWVSSWRSETVFVNSSATAVGYRGYGASYASEKTIRMHVTLSPDIRSTASFTIWVHTDSTRLWMSRLTALAELTEPLWKQRIIVIHGNPKDPKNSY